MSNPWADNVAPIIGAISGLLATVFAFVNVRMTVKQNQDLAHRDVKRDLQNKEVKDAIAAVPDAAATQTLAKLDVSATGNNRQIEAAHDND